MLGWIRSISLPDIFTIMNAILGLLAITYIVDGNFIFGSFLILVCILTDKLDGTFARKFGSKHVKGRYLDSISDTISFCLAPAILVYQNFYIKSIGLMNIQNVVTVIAFLVVFVFGVLRLIRYSRRGYLLKNFSGVPTPANAFFVIVICFLFGKEATGLPIISSLPIIALPIIIIISFMMLSDVEFPKMRLSNKTFLPLLALSIIISSIVYYTYYLGIPIWHEIFKVIVFAMFVVVLLYLIVGPFLTKKNKPKTYDYKQSYKQYKKYHKRYKKKYYR